MNKHACVWLCIHMLVFDTDGVSYVPFAIFSCESCSLAPDMMLRGSCFLMTAVLTGVGLIARCGFSLHFPDG